MKYTILLLALLSLVSCSKNRYSSFKGDIESISEKTYSCTEKFGEIIKEKLIEGRSYHFDENKLSKYELYNEEGERIYSSEIKYEKGKPILKKYKQKDIDRETYESIQVEKTRSLISRDSQNEIWLRTINNKIDTIFCKLDKYGYVCLEKENDMEGNIRITEFKRDKNRNIIEIKYSENNKVTSTTKYEYDENGFETSMEEENFRYNKWKKTTVYKHKTDETGNWIERIAYIDNVPKTITLREIKYNE